MDLAGDIVQSLANYLGLEDLPSTAHFPTDTLKLENLIARYRRKNLFARYSQKNHIARYIVKIFVNRYSLGNCIVRDSH